MTFAPSLSRFIGFIGMVDGRTNNWKGAHCEPPVRLDKDFAVAAYHYLHLAPPVSCAYGQRCHHELIHNSDTTDSRDEHPQ